LFHLLHQIVQKIAKRKCVIRVVRQKAKRRTGNPTKRLWQYSRWNTSAGRAIGNKEDAKTLNACLDTLMSISK